MGYALTRNLHLLIVGSGDHLEYDAHPTGLPQESTKGQGNVTSVEFAAFVTLFPVSISSLFIVYNVF